MWKEDLDSIFYFNIFFTIICVDGLPPVIDKSSTPSVTIDQFNEFSLFCEGYGLPSPKKQWFKVKWKPILIYKLVNLIAKIATIKYTVYEL